MIDKPKTKKQRSKSKQAGPAVELVPDAWPKFEQFIRDVVKGGPQHRKAKPRKPKGAESSKRRPSN